MDTKALAAELAPKLQVILERRKPEVIAAAGGFLARHEVEAAWPLLQREVPNILAAGLELLDERLGAMTLAEAVGAVLAARKGASA